MDIGRNLAIFLETWLTKVYSKFLLQKFLIIFRQAEALAKLDQKGLIVNTIVYRCDIDIVKWNCSQRQ